MQSFNETALAKCANLVAGVVHNLSAASPKASQAKQLPHNNNNSNNCNNSNSNNQTSPTQVGAAAPAAPVPAPTRQGWQLKHKYTLSEIQQHSTLDDCWIVIFDKVYDITDFVNEHPGGDFILLEYAGRDATHPFLSSRHGSAAYKLLDKYWIGILVDEELYYSNNSSYCSVYSNLSWREKYRLLFYE